MNQTQFHAKKDSTTNNSTNGPLKVSRSPHFIKKSSSYSAACLSAYRYREAATATAPETHGLSRNEEDHHHQSAPNHAAAPHQPRRRSDEEDSRGSTNDDNDSSSVITDEKVKGK
ncbi:hypothetical protein F3Y22_tig00110319pilonHSYRG00150 [Hibiscus syriacus]|uniref:Uncharacterized protein n=1 Tax=Hibiscus syriacus TaxID=106335 RepID=A0A6A3B4S3_HIBSY|nr:hypothetical protein F3Y22_tig00110319pilonHSYRG00150 [Hibiscus syriacus]